MTDSKAGAVQIFLLPQLVEALSSAPSVIQTDLFAFISRFSANPEEIPYKERKSQEVPEGFRIFTLNSAWSVVVAEPAPDLKIIAKPTGRRQRLNGRQNTNSFRTMRQKPAVTSDSARDPAR